MQVHSDGHEITINVEYNQLDPLLRATPGMLGPVYNAFGVHMTRRLLACKLYIRYIRACFE